MLILTRKTGESFLLELPDGETVEIQVAELTGNQARLGITAPASCRIWRAELYQTVQANRQAAEGVSALRGLARQLGGKEGPA